MSVVTILILVLHSMKHYLQVRRDGFSICVA